MHRQCTSTIRTAKRRQAISTGKQISGSVETLTKEAVKYTEQKAGDYSYLYDGQGNVTTTMRAGQISDSYSYDPFGEITQ